MASFRFLNPFYSFMTCNNMSSTLGLWPPVLEQLASRACSTHAAKQCKTGSCISAVGSKIMLDLFPCVHLRFTSLKDSLWPWLWSFKFMDCNGTENWKHLKFLSFIIYHSRWLLASVSISPVLLFNSAWVKELQFMRDNVKAVFQQVQMLLALVRHLTDLELFVWGIWKIYCLILLSQVHLSLGE